MNIGVLCTGVMIKLCCGRVAGEVVVRGVMSKVTISISLFALYFGGCGFCSACEGFEGSFDEWQL